MCKCIFHQFAVKNVNVIVLIMIYCQHNWIFLRRKKKYWYSLFDRPEWGFVRAKTYLAGYHDRQPAVHYFQPCIKLQIKLQFILLNSYL